MMKRILLVDDDKDILTLTERWLTRAGYEVMVADSGAGALEICKGGAVPDLILLDVAMPEMDGPATLQAIRFLDQGKEIPVLFRTGMEDLVTISSDQDPYYAGAISKGEGKPSLLAAVSKVFTDFP